jgi:hypothetical protein
VTNHENFFIEAYLLIVSWRFNLFGCGIGRLAKARMNMKRWVLAGALLGTLSVAVGCGSKTTSSEAAAGSSGVGGEAGQTDGAGGAPCNTQAKAAVSALTSRTDCVQDSDCGEVQAICFASESSNCAGIFGVSKSAISAVQAIVADFDACTGASCNAAGSCGLGGVEKCVAGQCASPGQ